MSDGGNPNGIFGDYLQSLLGAAEAMPVRYAHPTCDFILLNEGDAKALLASGDHRLPLPSLYAPQSQWDELPSEADRWAWSWQRILDGRHSLTFNGVPVLIARVAEPTLVQRLRHKM